MKVIKSIISLGFENYIIDVESHASNGLPTTTIVGLASKVVDESKERVRAAIQAAGLQYPKRKIIINLAPADLPKESTCLDLAIALAILQTNGDLHIPTNTFFLGELGLDGSIRGVNGILGKLSSLNNQSIVFLPADNAAQASLLADSYPQLFSASTLREIIDHLMTSKQLHRLTPSVHPSPKPRNHLAPSVDFADIYGQETAKRALVIAAAGGHNILLEGPPGTGKSMLAKALPTILPVLSHEQMIETTHLHSIYGKMYGDELIDIPPFRSPHHSSTDISLIGGGHALKPGEISLAHNGVLFLDELPEFRRSTIESLRQPLEDQQISIARAHARTTYPANFMLVATSNPCPCGNLNSEKPCTCTAAQVQLYQKKLSGPILDRIDIFVHVGNINHDQLLTRSAKRESPELQKRIELSRERQIKRQKNLNSQLTNNQLKNYIELEKDAKEVIDRAADSLGLSPRSYMRTLKVARTIADIEESHRTTLQHVSEALQYRHRTQAV